MASRNNEDLQPEVYYALMEVEKQRDDIKEVIKEVKDFRLEAHGRITKLETKAGQLGFLGGLVGGGLVSILVKLVVDLLMQ